MARGFGCDAIGLGSFQPWAKPDGGAAPKRSGHQEAVSRGHMPSTGGCSGRPARQIRARDSPASLRRMVEDVCDSLGRPISDVEQWLERFQVQWVDSIEGLRGLTAEEWRRLAVPVGLEAELRRRLGTSTRPSSAPVRRAPSTRSAPVRRAPNTQAVRRPGLAEPRMRGSSCWKVGRRATELDGICAELYRKRGSRWTFDLLRLLHRHAKMGVDVLTSALRDVGLEEAMQDIYRPSGVRSQAQKIFSVAAPSGGEPTAEAVVAALHGPLKSAQSNVVFEAFKTLVRPTSRHAIINDLRRRCAIIHHPAVKTGILSAEEASQSLFRPWRLASATSAEEFLASHIPLSGLFAPDDFPGFKAMVDKLWSVPRKETHHTSFCSVEEDVRRSEPQLTDMDASGDRFVHRRQYEDTNEEDRVAIENRVRKSKAAKSILERLRMALRRRGSPDTIAKIASSFRVHGGRNDNRIDPLELEVLLRRVGIGMSVAEVDELFRAIDANHDGTIDFEEWLRVVRGPMCSRRLAAVHEVFDALDPNGDGVVDMEEMMRCFRPLRHPDVESGRRQAREVLTELMSSLGDINRDGRLTLQEFVEYYEGVSASVDSDQYFVHIVRSAWGLDDSNPCGQYSRNASHAYRGHLVLADGGILG